MVQSFFAAFITAKLDSFTTENYASECCTFECRSYALSKCRVQFAFSFFDLRVAATEYQD
ncbi:MAG: hypothetical protein PHH26_04025, partial [Candidatus Thermoplasmatota archaeon]|nr:hypothetical protein [Candidatus Thermoplasmatota archaeon]